VSASGVLFRIGAVMALIWLSGFVVFTATIPTSLPLAIRTDAVVVLTGGPGRLARGVTVLDADAAQRMLVSGVGKDVTREQLAVALETDANPHSRIAKLALFHTRVDLGYGAVDTRSNAQETAAWMTQHRYRSLRLVTSAWHMRRATLELRAQLPSDIAILGDAVPVEPAAASVAREYSKFILRWVVLAAGVAT
jgi:uncharacterized SAM-binding protein YcdF (DUF218 family)